jgi:methionyl-tRNA formyltransferase
MSPSPGWWKKPRKVSVVVDNDSWVVPHTEELVRTLNDNGDEAVLCRAHDDVAEGAVAYYIGCTSITPPEVLARSHRNLVVHASDLPKGRGFSPLTWQILEGCNDIPVCLLEAAAEVDSGPIVYRDGLRFEGHELIDEMRNALGRKTVEMCLRFMDEETPPRGVSQEGEPTRYSRRHPEDSRLDPDRTIAEQFDLLRVVDNNRYPAYFDYRGRRYRVMVEKSDDRD